MKLTPKGPQKLSRQFNSMLRIMQNEHEPMFITGRAGTGKSTLLQLFKKTSDRNVVVLAPTGIAALNVKGQTIHSFFGFPPKFLHPSEIGKRRNRSLYMKLDILIIDEISMVRADMLDNIDRFLRINRNNPEPFGGVKVLFFGDLFQLPPVIATPEERHYLQEHYETPYFYSAHVFNREYGVQIHELTEVLRQTDGAFIHLLDRIRLREMDYDDLVVLNEQHQPNFEDDDYYITLCSRKFQAQQINRNQLDRLASEEFTYLATVSGDFSDRQFPTQLALKLRVGAQIMFIKNDPKRRFVNGTIGKIVALEVDLIKVSIKNEHGEYHFIDVETNEWEIIKYRLDPKTNKIKAEPIGTFKQYPLKLAWAMTIHKAQGKTFDRVIIDLGKGAFESGQTYVALSRCRTLEGIILKQPLRPQDIMVDPTIAEFYQQGRY